MLSRQDYVVIARAISNSKRGTKDNEVLISKDFVELLCFYFGATNKRFDEEKFYEACGRSHHYLKRV